MFANTQMMGLDTGFPDVCLSPLRQIGQMAQRTSDPAALRVLQAGLKAMIEESKATQAYAHDRVTAEADLAYLNAKLGNHR